MPETTLNTNFETIYLSLRQREGRLFSDEEVVRLPEAPKLHPLKREWTIRQESSLRLISYLSKKKKALKILEVGCGNGWLCHHLSQIPGASVTGLDVNEFELQQARRLFPSLSFIYGDYRKLCLERYFDIIVFAATLQYFPSVQDVIEKSLSYLKPKGEVHVLDTHFYSQEQQEESSWRSAAYFTALGYPQMSSYYFHHKIEDLAAFHSTMMYDPNRFLNRLRNRSPFPWIRIIKK